MNDLQKKRLLKLIDIAQRNGHQIVVVNQSFDAYCPTIGISFPNYEACFDRLYRILSEKNLSPQESYDLTVAIIGTKYTWANLYSSHAELLDASHFAAWITKDGNILSTYKSNDISIKCKDLSVIWYHELPLPQEVKPVVCPFLKVVDEWCFIANGCSEFVVEDEEDYTESLEYVSWILKRNEQNKHTIR
ncbi:hypothetical protein ACFVS2_26010 [Brevibacillus sp. NPDC058079]|uniref:hypothetical protein n=1 Tax=Brevibacillus sp. NPDC058079 TaxID=3346330 RepID=UPI0036EF54CD